MALSDDIATWLEELGLAGGQTGWFLAVDHEPPVGDFVTERTVTVYVRPGGIPSPRTHLASAQLQVRVRGTSEDGAEAEAQSKIAELAQALHDAGPRTMGATIVRWITARDSVALTLGPDDSGRPIYVWNFQVGHSF